MAGKASAWLILIALLSSVIGAYFLAWRGKNLSMRRGAAWIVAVLSAVAGVVGTVGYAIPALDDFHNPEVPIKVAILGNLVVWAICVGALIVAARFVRLALRKT
jgi:hypothetical protein